MWQTWFFFLGGWEKLDAPSHTQNRENTPKSKEWTVTCQDQWNNPPQCASNTWHKLLPGPTGWMDPESYEVEPYKSDPRASRQCIVMLEPQWTQQRPKPRGWACDKWTHWLSNRMEEYRRWNKNLATESQNKCAMRNVTARAVYHSCRRKSSGSGGEGHTFEDRTNDRA